MGLNERHLKKFNNNRLYSSILVEVKCGLFIYFIYSVYFWNELLTDVYAFLLF